MTIYIAEEVGCDYAVKIGVTDRDVENRLAELQTGNPRKLRIVRVLEGDEAEERRLHELFAEERLLGEWFRLSDRVRQFAYGGVVPDNEQIKIATEHHFGDVSVSAAPVTEKLEISKKHHVGDVSVSAMLATEKIVVSNGIHKK